MVREHQAILAAIEARKNDLSETIIRLRNQRQPGVWQGSRGEGSDLAVRDEDLHFTYLLEAISDGDTSLFANYAGWLKQLFDGLKFPESALKVMLECIRDVLREALPQEMSSVTDQYLQAGLERIQSETGHGDSFIFADNPLRDLAFAYLNALLTGERRAASKAIMDAVARGVPIKDIYLFVFQPSQYEVGRLWVANRISVAQEHYCSAATQLIMSQLYPYIFSAERIGLTFVAACVPGELHEIGVRTVSDFFEMAGWDTYYLGANTPTESIIRAVREREAAVLGISATMAYHRSALGDLIATIRSHKESKMVKILVGGYTIRESTAVWRRLGADGFAPSAEQAVAVANQLLAEEVPDDHSRKD